ncbi:MAG: hypothetical protein ACRDRR_14015 [Pseudonocardiaceae bacterium]
MELAVAGSPQQYHCAFSAGAGDRSASGFGTSAGSIKKEGPVITEIAEHLGAKDQTESRQTTLDPDVRVVLKIGVQRGPPLLYGIERGRLLFMWES